MGWTLSNKLLMLMVILPIAWTIGHFAKYIRPAEIIQAQSRIPYKEIRTP